MPLELAWRTDMHYKKCENDTTPLIKASVGVLKSINMEYE